MSITTVVWIGGAAIAAGVLTAYIGPIGIVVGAIAGIVIGAWRGLVD